MRKLNYIIPIILLSLTITACGKKQLMDKPADDGKLHYKNADLGFEIALPADFEYYQTQRKNSGDYTDLEIFVPTSDKRYPQIVPGYARPITMRVYTKEAFDNITDDEREEFEVLNEGKDRTHAIRFWNLAPLDWLEKWNDEMRREIIDNIIIN